MKLPIDLNNVNQKHRIFVQVAIGSLIAFPVLILIVSVRLMLDGIPVNLWKKPLIVMFILGVFLVCTASLLSLLYGYLKFSKVKVLFSTLIFGLATPTVMFLLLCIPSWFKGDFSSFAIDSSDGLVNFIFLYVLFGVLGGLIYIAPNKQLNKDATTVAPIS